MMDAVPRHCTVTESDTGGGGGRGRLGGDPQTSHARVGISNDAPAAVPVSCDDDDGAPRKRRGAAEAMASLGARARWAGWGRAWDTHTAAPEASTSTWLMREGDPMLPLLTDSG
jgi:hypothetical protein